MKKGFFGLLIFIMVCAVNVTAVSAACTRFTAQTEVDGKNVSFTGYDVDGKKLVKIWDLAGVLKNTVCMFDLSWNSVDKQLNILPMYNYSGELSGADYSTAEPVCSESAVYLKYNGDVTEIPAYLINGSNYVEMNAAGYIMGYDIRVSDDGSVVEFLAGDTVIKKVRLNTFTDSKCIALTFDDGPMKGSTEKILAALDKVGGHATFFVVGEMVDEYPYLVKSIIEQGSEVGNHTYDHSRLTDLSDADILKEIYSTSNSVYAAAGVYPYIGRPPYGAINEVVKTAVNIDWYNWNIDTLDWKYRDPEYVYNYVMENVKDGDVVLMHDLHPTTAQAMEKAIPDLAAKGFKLVTIDELAQAKGKENIKGFVK